MTQLNHLDSISRTRALTMEHKGWATASPQPALALRAEPASGLVASRFDQAQW